MPVPSHGSGGGVLGVGEEEDPPPGVGVGEADDAALASAPVSAPMPHALRSVTIASAAIVTDADRTGTRTRPEIIRRRRSAPHRGGPA